MTAPRPPLPRALVAGLALVALGLGAWVLSAVVGGNENHSFDPHGAPPATVHVTAGRTYWLAVPGGVQHLQDLGVVASALRCTATGADERTVSLPVTAVVSGDSVDTKFVNRIASFVPDRTGSLHVDCAGVGTPYVENADGAGYDWSGLLLVLASALLVVGLPVLLSGLRRARSHPAGDAGRGAPDHPGPGPRPRPSPIGTGQQHQVE